MLQKYLTLKKNDQKKDVLKQKITYNECNHLSDSSEKTYPNATQSQNYG